MTTLGQLNARTMSAVAEIPHAEVRVLWVDDYWDGPLSGVAEWNGRRLRFVLADLTALGQEEGPRQYWLIALSPEQLLEEERWNDLFCTHVWTGFDYTGRPEYHVPASEHAKFYDLYRARTVPDYSENEVVGWFEL